MIDTLLGAGRQLAYLRSMISAGGCATARPKLARLTAFTRGDDPYLWVEALP